MATLLSPGVVSTIIDASQIVPTVGTSTTVFCGDFQKGDVNDYNLITSYDELKDIYGLPTKTNRNNWYQAYNFLRYSNTLLLVRAANVNGSKVKTTATLTSIGKVTLTDQTSLRDDVADLSTSSVKVVSEIPENPDPDVLYIVGDPDEESEAEFVEHEQVEIVDYHYVSVSRATDLVRGMIIQFGDIEERYLITEIIGNVLKLDHEVPSDPENSEHPDLGSEIIQFIAAFNGSQEILDSTQTERVAFNDSTVNIAAQRSTAELFQTNRQILNTDDFELTFDSIAFSTPSAKLKIVSRNPGTWCQDLRICVATPASFVTNNDYDTHIYHYVAEGITVDSLFEYAPTGTQIGLVLYDENKEEVVESWLVDLTRGAKDDNGNSSFAENVINNNSSYIYVKVNDSNTNDCGDYTLIYDQSRSKYVGTTLQLRNCTDSPIQQDDLLDAYEVFSNKEIIDIDVIIANELDNGVSAHKLAEERQDCICYIGANYGDLVGKKSTVCISNLIKWRKTGYANFDSRYCVAVGSYKFMYDRINDEYFWCNIAADAAGLRAQTNSNQEAWYASAGLTRGILADVVKLAFNPTQAQRDMMYKNNINPIVTFPAQGTVLYGQKTMQSAASSFDRVNVVSLFNVIVRALEKMSRYSVMEFNDEYTRNRIVSMINPYLQTVKSARGLQDYMVICDTTNNTDDVISRNELRVDIYLKPTYVAEYIHLSFINAGVNDFSTVIQ